MHTRMRRRVESLIQVLYPPSTECVFILSENVPLSLILHYADILCLILKNYGDKCEYLN